MAPAQEEPPEPPAVSLATHHVMQANRSRDTGPELLVRKGLRERGLTGYRLQWKRTYGRPDVAFPGRHVAIFVNGCFWHRCPYCHPSVSKTRAQFWQDKFARNEARDRRNEQALLADGWTVLVVWECRLKRGRARRTVSQVACEVRLRGRGSAHAPTTRPRVIVVGNGLSCRERAVRQLLGRARLRRGARRPARAGARHG